jgi:putative SOS response-associated peptidase YedK
MCNLNSVTKGQEAIRRLFEIQRDMTGNLALLPGVYPDSMAPVVRLGEDGARELVMMRWGFPCPPNFGGAHVTNVRNAQSPYWRGWLKPPYRCLVLATSFCEWEQTTPKKTPT